MATFLLITGVILLSAGIVEAFRHPSAGAVASYAGLVAMLNSGYGSPLTQQALLFWAIAVIMVCGISMAGGDTRQKSHPVANRYIAGGALVGMLAALTLGQSAMIVGSAVGAVLGGVAWSRTPSGKSASVGLWRIVVSDELPAVVTMTVIGMAVGMLLIKN